jgi:hypothetical protein
VVEGLLDALVGYCAYRVSREIYRGYGHYYLPFFWVKKAPKAPLCRPKKHQYCSCGNTCHT